jgi:inositol oxygenase
MLKSLSVRNYVDIEEEKRKDQFRNYTDSLRTDLVNDTYLQNHVNQTVQFVEVMRDEYSKFEKATMTLWQALDRLDEIKDNSDPDTDHPQNFHAYQTAEVLRYKYPEIEWLPLVGLIHDLGKILVLPEIGGLPQWATVGDNYPVGCAHSEKIVKHEFFQYNKDSVNPAYNSLYGIYSPHCGLENVKLAWGHDEYMYQVCKNNGSTLPDVALYIIRYHSFYAWHQEGAYAHFASQVDRDNLFYLKAFQKHDLYSKLPEIPDVDTLLPYYKKLVDKYFPPVLSW